ncbi:hypothetical protein L9F63_007522, partial [Diploptera punctata]
RLECGTWDKVYTSQISRVDIMGPPVFKLAMSNVSAFISVLCIPFIFAMWSVTVNLTKMMIFPFLL